MGALIAFFFALQSYGLSHASTYGDAPHEHDGIDCVITMAADDHVVVMPTINAVEIVIHNTPLIIYPNFQSANFLSPQSRAPPPRAPPTSI